MYLCSHMRVCVCLWWFRCVLSSSSLLLLLRFFPIDLQSASFRENQKNCCCCCCCCYCFHSDFFARSYFRLTHFLTVAVVVLVMPVVDCCCFRLTCTCVLDKLENCRQTTDETTVSAGQQHTTLLTPLMIYVWKSWRMK